MWIRSQNKKSLLNVNQVVTIPSVDKSKYFICNSLEKESVTLGVYSTEEKVLKVLDEIQDAIEDTGYYRIDNIGHGTYALGKGVQVYQMPQDDEVEV
jgi:hypothetical protein